jgi:hypothetical protein
MLQRDDGRLCAASRKKSAFAKREIGIENFSANDKGSAWRLWLVGRELLADFVGRELSILDVA